MIPKIHLPGGRIYDGRVENPTENETLTLRDGRKLKRLGFQDMLYREGSSDTIELWAWETKNGLHVLSSVDPTPHGKLLHVSVSYEKTDPSWKDIFMVREVFYPDDVDVMMILPKAEDYVNHHEHTFHMFQTPVGWGMR